MRLVSCGCFDIRLSNFERNCKVFNCWFWVTHLRILRNLGSDAVFNALEILHSIEFKYPFGFFWGLWFARGLFVVVITARSVHWTETLNLDICDIFFIVFGAFCEASLHKVSILLLLWRVLRLRKEKQKSKSQFDVV